MADLVVVVNVVKLMGGGCGESDGFVGCEQ